MGTGNIGDKNITQEEMKRDVELNKPYWFVADSDGGFISVVFPGVSSMMKIESKIEVDEDVRTAVEKINERINERINEGLKETEAIGVSDEVKTKLAKVLQTIVNVPGCKSKQIIEATQIPSQSLNRYLSLLSQAGFIQYVGSKRTGGYYASHRDKIN